MRKLFIEQITPPSPSQNSKRWQDNCSSIEHLNLSTPIPTLILPILIHIHPIKHSLQKSLQQSNPKINLTSNLSSTLKHPLSLSLSWHLLSNASLYLFVQLLILMVHLPDHLEFSFNLKKITPITILEIPVLVQSVIIVQITLNSLDISANRMNLPFVSVAISILSVAAYPFWRRSPMIKCRNYINFLKKEVLHWVGYHH